MPRLISQLPAGCLSMKLVRSYATPRYTVLRSGADARRRCVVRRSALARRKLRRHVRRVGWGWQQMDVHRQRQARAPHTRHAGAHAVALSERNAAATPCRTTPDSVAHHLYFVHCGSSQGSPPRGTSRAVPSCCWPASLSASCFSSWAAASATGSTSTRTRVLRVKRAGRESPGRAACGVRTVAGRGGQRRQGADGEPWRHAWRHGQTRARARGGGAFSRRVAHDVIDTGLRQVLLVQSASAHA